MNKIRNKEVKMKVKANGVNWFFSGLPQQQIIRLCLFNDKNIQEAVSIAQIYSYLCNGKNKQADIDEVIVKQEIDNNHIEYIIKKPLQIDSRSDNTWKNELVFNLSLVDNLNGLMVDYFNKRYGWEGKNFTTKFKDSVAICCDFEQELKIQKCTFDKGLEIWTNAKINFAKGVVFENCEFNDKVSFKNAVFGSKEQMEFVNINFKDCKFKNKVDFSNCKFYGNVYFNNSIFKDYVDFHESEFNQTACFYGVTFEKVPNFSQTLFRGNLNLINTNLDFDFEKCEKVVENELANQKYKLDVSTLDKIANNFRDSFRGFKSALIKDNNLLDASNYHKIELYFKEIELKHKELTIFSKEWIDLWQLKFYRATSNHHTDLLKIWDTFTILIGVFALLVLGITILCGKVEYMHLNFIQCLSINTIIVFLFIGLFLVGIFGKITLNSMIVWVLLIFLPQYLFMNSYMLIFTLTLLFCSLIFIFRKIAVYFSYFATFVLLIINPKYIIPAINIFTDKQKVLDPLATIGVIYTILSILLIFSLQKTARRNSIIPA